MAGRSVLARIDDMLAAIGMIETIMRDTPAVGPERTVADLALERAIEIVSEASRHIPEDLKAAETEVRWRMLAGIGNVLRHDYQSVQRDIIANAITFDVPILKSALLRMLEKLDPSSSS